MTREEASNILDDFDVNFEGHTAKEVAEAFDVAFKALEQEPCEDCISRHDALNCVTFNEFRYRIVEDIKALPSVTPKEKTGHWIVDWSATSRLNRDRSLTYEYHVHCDKCGYRWDYTTDKKGSLVSNFCPNCGARMVEPQESEDKE